MKTKPFYHITSVYLVSPILGEGLKGGLKPRNRTETLAVPSVFVLTTNRPGVMDAVATNQIWPFQDVGEYAVLEINPSGVTGRVLLDRVMERTAAFQRIIQQEIIPPGSIKHVENRRIDFPGGKLFEIQRKVVKREQVAAEEWELFRRYVSPMVFATWEQLAVSPARGSARRGSARSNGTQARKPKNGN